jgi:hypothetical protein
VVDVHHKPRGLTSLPRCLLSQVHKVQHKPRKKFSWGLNLIWSKGLESVLPVAHRTVSGAPGRAALKPATLGFLHGTLCYNSPDCPVCTGTCPVCQRSNGNMAPTVDCHSEQCKLEVRAEKSECTGHVWCGTRLSGETTGQTTSTTDCSKPQWVC